jgi:hypothetical protein
MFDATLSISRASEPSFLRSFGFVQSLEMLDRQLGDGTDPMNANVPSDAASAIDESGRRYHRRINGRKIEANGTAWWWQPVAEPFRRRCRNGGKRLAVP